MTLERWATCSGTTGTGLEDDDVWDEGTEWTVPADSVEEGGGSIGGEREDGRCNGEGALRAVRCGSSSMKAGKVGARGGGPDMAMLNGTLAVTIVRVMKDAIQALCRLAESV